MRAGSSAHSAPVAGRHAHVLRACAGNTTSVTWRWLRCHRRAARCGGSRSRTGAGAETCALACAPRASEERGGGAVGSTWVGGDVCMRRDRRYQSVRRYQPGALACSAPPLQAVWPCGVGVARPRVPLPRLPCLPSAARCHRHRCRCRRRRCAPRCWVRRHPRMLPQSPPLLTRKAFHPPRRGLLRTTQIKAGRSMI